MKLEDIQKKETRLPPDLRLCNYCNTNKCEDEYHFTIECPYYKNERNTLIEKIAKDYPHIRNVNSQELFIWFMANLDPKVITSFTKFIYECFNKRANIQNVKIQKDDKCK